MYYREFGIPARIARCYSVEELESQIIKHNGVSIVGNSFLASELAHDASNLFSNNIFNFIDYMVKDGKFIDQEDDIYNSCKI